MAMVMVETQVSAGGVSQSSEIAWLLEFHRNLQRCNIDMLEQHLRIMIFGLVILFLSSVILSVLPKCCYFKQ